MLRAWFLHRLGRRPRRQGRTQRTSRSRSLVTEMESLEGRALNGDQCSRLDGRARDAPRAVRHRSERQRRGQRRRRQLHQPGRLRQADQPGLDVFNKPEVYAIGVDNAVWVKDGRPWVSLGGYAKEISATVENTVYAIGLDDAVWVNNGGPWVSLGGYAKQISAGADASGNPEVFAIGIDDAVWVKDGSNPWVGLGGYAKQISATMDNTVYAIGGGNAVYENSGGVWVFLGGYAKQISTASTASASPRSSPSVSTMASGSTTGGGPAWAAT